MKISDKNVINPYDILGFYDFIEYIKTHDYDLKILIVASDSWSGTGKTTLGLHLCEMLDETFDPDRIVYNAKDYISRYNMQEDNTAILWEEMGRDADNRRSMSKGNLNISHLWQYMRFRNLYTVATVPSRRVIDVRLIELSTVIIYVNGRGIATPYKSRVKDLHDSLYPERFRFSEGSKQKIFFADKSGEENYEIAKDFKEFYTNRWSIESLKDMEEK